MKNDLNFKNWVLNEFADFGFGSIFSTKIKGGTSVMQGNNVFYPFKCHKMLSELAQMPPIGPLHANHSWSNIVEYGTDFGSLQVQAQPLGSFRIQIRQKINDLQGNPTWIIKKIIPICDYKDIGMEETIKNNIYDILSEISQNPILSCDREYKLDELAQLLWSGVKSNHPSYIMFPYAFRKQSDTLYKYVFEMKGQGVGTPSQNSTGRTEQFNIDLMWDEKKGLIRTWAYDIGSNINKHTWSVAISEWDEYFSPHEKRADIVTNILATFLQY
jgi:hypothetical protein